MSQETWNKVLTESQRQHLMTFLPKFPEKENEERRDTLRKLFNGENFKFGNPLQKFHLNLKDGSFSPDIAKYTTMIRRMKHQEYRNKQKKYYHNMLKDILLSRQRVFDQLAELPYDEPVRFEHVPSKQPKDSTLKQRVHRKYKRYLDEVRKECGVDLDSSDEDVGSPVDRSKKQLFKSLNPVPSPEPVIPSVHCTYAPKLEYINGDIDSSTSTLKRPRPISPPEVTEDTYRELLIKHKRRQLYDDYDEEEHPEYNTQNITLQDVMSRCQASRKGGNEPDDDTIDPTLFPINKSKIKKARPEKIVRKKTAKKIRDMDFSGGGEADDDDDDDDESRTNVSIDVTEDDASTVDQFPMHGVKIKEENILCASFFGLLKNFIINSPDNRISAVKLEDRVREWQDSSNSDDCTWISLQDDWVDLVQSALKFLAGETIGMNVDHFIPYLDYKERAQQWHWIGVGRDSEENLLQWCNHWLKHKGEVSELIIDTSQGSPPPARIRTGYVVKATSEEEKADFQRQEKLRFEEPHKAFTYEMHGYQSVVGPVKGVFIKKNDTNKAREHALLVSNRPAFVTILTLVRDAVARLPNGEGNRGEICELLKDSQFLAPGITDAQINVVVSGALDRLHSEKDPCVKYDVNRKVWIYLHRNRTEEEFEKIHQAQAAAQKAKKSLAKVKTSKTATPKLRDMTGSQPGSVSSLGLPTSLGSSSESINVEDVSPGHIGSQAQLLAGQSVVQTAKVSARPSSTSKNAGVTQSLTPAQLQLLQQAAAAQAAQAKAKAEAQTKVQATKTQNMSKSAAKVAGASPSKLDLVSKIQQSITLNQQSQVKVIPQTAVTSIVKGNIPANVTIQNQPEIQVQTLRQNSVTLGQSDGQNSPAIQVVTAVTKTVTMATSSSAGSPVTVISSSQASTNPLVARLMQQMSAGGQMVSVSSLLAAQRSLQQGQQPRGAIKIQGGNVLQQVSPGKPVQLTGKPVAHAKGQILQLGGKGQQTLGVIQTAQGTINIIPQAGHAGGMVTLSQPKTTGIDSSQAVATVVTTVGQPSASQVVRGQLIGQTNSSAANQSGVVVTQLMSGGNITVRPTVTGSQGKVITQGQTGLVPAQLILQQTPSGLKPIESQTTADATGTSVLVSSATGTPQSPSLQMVRTVLSQQAGLKPGQATILISQPALQQGQVLPPGHLVQNVRTQGKVTQQGKQPVFARIINPASNLNVKLAGGVQTFPAQGSLIQAVRPAGQNISVQNDAALRQTLSKLVTGSGSVSSANVLLTSVVSSGSSISTSQQILAAAAAGKAAQIKEMEKDKKS
ncbi:hypothetical protein ACF0H5_011175 [Mactra antiquata]